MAEAPSLSEITNITVDPERGSGTPAVVYDQREMVRNLNQAAQFKAQNDLNKYQFFVKNLQEVYKNADEIAAMDVMTEDQPYLKEKAAEIYSDILKDPRAIYSPELQGKLGQLRSDATESKQNRLFDIAHREFINKTPELNTEVNKSKIDAFRTQKLGQRQAYNLDMPTLFDIDTFRTTLLSHPTVKTAFAESQVTPDKQFIKEVSGNKYDRKKFLDAWNLALSSKQDKYGHSIKGAADQMFNQLSDADKDYWKKNGGIKAFWNYIGEKSFGGDSDVIEKVKDNLQANPNYLDREKLNLAWANFGLEKEKLDKEDDEDLLSADSVIAEAASIINNGTPIEVYNYDGPKTGKKTVLEIADPLLLKDFGNIDKDGNVVNRPDVIQYDPGKDELNLIYWKRVRDDEGKPTDQIEVQSNGRKNIDRRVPINARTWLNQKVKQRNPNKDIGGVNRILETVFKKAGGNLKSLSDVYMGKTTAPADPLSQYDIPSGAKVVYSKNGTPLGYEYKGKKFKFE